MGWFFENVCKKGMIAQLITGRDKVVCVAHCYRGNRFSGILWSVWEDQTVEVGPRMRWIGCDIMKYQDGSWGYKPLSEGMHPYYYSCPLGYLKMAPEASKEWRKFVVQYHNQRKKKCKSGKSLQTA